MGKPTTRNGVVLYAESIGVQRYTRGTETSKYPEEEKTIVIPSVAASERGVAQTARLRPVRGCGACTTECAVRVGEESGKAHRRE